MIRNLAESANVDPKAASIAPSTEVDFCELCASFVQGVQLLWLSVARQARPGGFALASLRIASLAHLQASCGLCDSDRVTF